MLYRSNSVRVFDFVDYRDFLQSIYDEAHASNPEISYSKIAEFGNFKSRTEVRNFIKGQQTPNIEQLGNFAQCFGLEPDESQYLVCLYRFNRAGSSEQSFQLFQRLLWQISSQNIERNPFRELEANASLLHITLLSMLEWEAFELDAKWIRSRLRIQHSDEEIERAFTDLKIFGCVTWDEEAGRYRLNQSYVKKIDNKANFLIRQFHRQCLKLAEESLDGLDMADRYLVASSIAIPEAHFSRIVQKINAFLDTLVRSEKLSANRDCVAQVNIQIIKIANSVLGPVPAERNSNFNSGIVADAVIESNKEFM